MKIHRYSVRPGVTKVPTQLPQGKIINLSEDDGVTLSVEIESRRKSLRTDDYNFDLQYFIVLDEDFGQPYTPFYSWVEGESIISTKYQLYIAKKYNEIMDNINWLIRDENKEKEVEVNIKDDIDVFSDDDIDSFSDCGDWDDGPALTLYELNQQAYDKVTPKTPTELENDNSIWRFITTHYVQSEYLMLLCKELSDYTVFHREGKSLEWTNASYEIMDILQSRGPILDFHYNQDGMYLECWVRYRQDSTPHMYVLFDADDFVIEC